MSAATPPAAKEAAEAGVEAAMPAGPKVKIRLGIGTKLVSLIALLLLGSVASLVWLSTNMIIEDSTALIQQMNSDTAGSLATRMRDGFREVTDKMRMLGTVMMQDTVPPDVRAQVTREFFSKDTDFLAVVIHKGVNSPAPTLLPAAVSPELGTLGDADGAKTLAALTAEKEYSLDSMSRGAIQLVPFRLPDGSGAIAVGIPFVAVAEAPGAQSAAAGAPTRFTHTLTAVIRQSKFLKAVAESDTVTSYMVDSRGRLLAHSDAARASANEDVSSVSIVRIMLEGKTNNGQTRYADPQTGEAKLGSFRLVGFGGLGIVSEVLEAKALEAAQNVKRRSIFIGLIVLCLSFFIGYAYSGTITWPIRMLVDAANRIAQGDFAINLKPKGRDEVAALSVAFNDMAKGLEERDKVKETFNKFHNKEIAEKLLSGEVKLGGERKEATIFFSDVRGFTAMSESMEPEQVVEMLNEYMTRMVSIIRAHNGIVDKYVGDAIMAIWGVPLGGPDDQLNAVKACIEMRAELARLNELRQSRGQNALKIGMGLNTGSVIAGNIGSNEKMEYTVIGDSVNLASRMESMTKEYGTDLLIPKIIRDRLDGKFIFEQCKSAKVKGKSQAIEIFKVKGYIDEAGNQVIVQTPYSEYESEKSDKVVHDEPAQAPTPAHAAADATTFTDLSNPHVDPMTTERTVSMAMPAAPVAMPPAPVAMPAPVAPQVAPPPMSMPASPVAVVPPMAVAPPPMSIPAPASAAVPPTAPPVRAAAVIVAAKPRAAVIPPAQAPAQVHQPPAQAIAAPAAPPVPAAAIPASPLRQAAKPSAPLDLSKIIETAPAESQEPVSIELPVLEVVDDSKKVA